MNESNVKRSSGYSVRSTGIDLIHHVRLVFLLFLLMASLVSTTTRTGASSPPTSNANPDRSKGLKMMVLDKDGKRKMVSADNSSRPQFDQGVFDNPEMKSGYFKGRRLRYLTKQGWAIIDGDIAVGRVGESSNSPGNARTFVQHEFMWPKVGTVFEVPYVITTGNSNIPLAISYFNTTFSGIIQWVARTSEPDYVNFDFDPGDFSGYGFSSLGRAGGPQQLGGSIAMSFQTLLHEMGHAVGLYHEQQRSDRDTYIEFHPENMSNASRWTSYQLADYFQLDGNIQDVGLYDYDSTMHYYWDNLSKNGGPVFESIPGGIQIGQYPPNDTSGEYPAGDIDAIKRLYDSTPTLVTVTSNPPGLQVIVDGATITTPQTYNWTLNSTHTLSIPSGGQTLGGKAFIYGRWNDIASETHDITVTAGDGRRVSPQDKPAITVYSANFINLIGFTNNGSFPGGTGSLTTTPLPQTYPGLTGTFYVARQPVILEATPNSGQDFYGWFGVYGWTFSSNPQTYRWDTNTPTGMSVQAGFSNLPVYTFTTNLPDIRLGILFDTTDFYYSPVNFSEFYDTNWAAGMIHTIDTYSPQSPFYFNTRHQFQNWSDGGAQQHDITLPGASTAYTANFNSQYRVILDTPCGGTPSVSPFSADGFYDAGSLLTISQTPFAGFVFTGWREDLTGSVSPQMVTLNDELYAQSNYNVNSTPLAITGIDPSAVVQNSPGFTLTINGTGFTSDRTFAFVNNVFTPITFIHASQITVPVPASDLTTVGGISIFVQNFPDGATCAVYNNRTLQIKFSGPSAAAVSISGRVNSASGSGIGKAAVRLTGPDGAVRTAITGPFGYFRFDDVEVGETYILSVAHKRYQFGTPSQVITLNDEVTDADFTALP